MTTSTLLPIWSLRTLDSINFFSIEEEYIEDIRMGKLLEPPVVKEIEIITYDEIAYKETEEDFRNITWEEVIEKSQTYQPLEYYYSECLWSKRLLELTLNAGVDNIQYWPVNLVHRLSSRSWEYYIVNIVGRIKINAKDLAELNIKMARDERSLTLLLTDPIKKEWENLNLNELTFMKQFPKFG